MPFKRSRVATAGATKHLQVGPSEGTAERGVKGGLLLHHKSNAVF